MNDSPGWASPSSSPPDPSEDRDRNRDQDLPPSDDIAQPSGGEPPRHWSAQPPPASGPGQSGHPSPPYGRPGWGSGPAAWNQPPAAKPGVIPLRPLGIGEILDGAVSTMRAYWRTVLGISLAVALVSQAVGTVVLGVWLQDTASIEEFEKDPDPTFGEFMDVMGGLLGGLGIAIAVSLFGSIVATAMLTMVISRAVLGRPVSVGEAWRDSRPQLWRLLGLLLLLPLIMGGAVLAGSLPGLLLSFTGAAAAGVMLMVLGALAGLVCAIWLLVRLSLAPPALMLEKQGVFDSMRRSVKLVRGSWWRVLGIQLLAQVLVFVIAGIIEVPADVIGRLAAGDDVSELVSGSVPTGWVYLVIAGIGAVIASTITFPISAGVTALLYIDQRIRREALDLELARVAGVPGFTAEQDDDRAPGS